MHETLDHFTRIDGYLAFYNKATASSPSLINTFQNSLTDKITGTNTDATARTKNVQWACVCSGVTILVFLHGTHRYIFVQIKN